MAEPPQSQSGWIIYKRLLKHVSHYWKFFSLSIFGMMIFAATDAGFAAFMKSMVDDGFVNKDKQIIQWLPVVLVGIFLLRALAGFIATYGMQWVARIVISDLRKSMFDRLLFLPTSYYDKSLTGQLISKFSYDVEQLASASSSGITILARDSFTVLGLLIWMFYLNWLLTLIILLTAPVIAVIVLYINRRFRSINQRIQSSMGDVSQTVEEAVRGHSVVKNFGGQSYEQEKFSQINKWNRRLYMKLAATTAISVQLMQFIAACALAGILFLATLDSMLAQISVGIFVSFMTAMLLLMPPLKRLTNVNAILQRGIAAAESVFSLMDENTEHDTGKSQLQRAKGEVEFDKVSFTYDSRENYALCDVSFTVQANQTVALVGHSGSGKSTLVKLLPRLYDVTEGRITIDGIDIKELSLQNLRQQISVVSQDVILFNDSVAMNIAYGNPQASQKDIEEAAKIAHADEFISLLPKGYETLVGENGIMLSGGQKQRIAIARAILKKAPILIFDEATSALDSESEHFIQHSMEQLRQNTTSFVVAHRLSTIEAADIILVMENGKIVESGNHSSLLEKNGYYAQLHAKQFAESA